MNAHSAWTVPRDVEGNRTWLVPSRDRGAILDAIRATALVLDRVDCSGAIGRRALLRRFASALDLPAWFGGNWDALADCLDDLSWRPAAHGRVLLVDGLAGCRAAQPAVVDLLIDLLDDVAARHAGRGAIFQSLVVLPSTTYDAQP